MELGVLSQRLMKNMKNKNNIANETKLCPICGFSFTKFWYHLSCKLIELHSKELETDIKDISIRIKNEKTNL